MDPRDRPESDGVLLINQREPIYWPQARKLASGVMRSRIVECGARPYRDGSIGRTGVQEPTTPASARSRFHRPSGGTNLAAGSTPRVDGLCCPAIRVRATWWLAAAAAARCCSMRCTRTSSSPASPRSRRHRNDVPVENASRRYPHCVIGRG